MTADDRVPDHLGGHELLVHVRLPRHLDFARWLGRLRMNNKIGVFFDDGCDDLARRLVVVVVLGGGVGLELLDEQAEVNGDVRVSE